MVKLKIIEKILLRTIDKLVPLEVDADESDSCDNDVDTNINNELPNRLVEKQVRKLLN